MLYYDIQIDIKTNQFCQLTSTYRKEAEWHNCTVDATADSSLSAPRIHRAWCLIITTAL